MMLAAVAVRADAELTVGATVGSTEDLEALLRLVARTGVRPVIDSLLGLTEVRRRLERLASGRGFGKIVIIPGR